MKRFHLAFAVSLILASSTAVAAAEDFTFDNRLVDAVDQGNTDIVAAMLQNGEDANSTGKFDTSALQRAAFRGNAELLNVLITNGADINAVDFGGASALHIAARQGNESIAKTLLQRGADINMQDGQGYSPLHRAVANKQLGLTQLLIRAGANINTVNNEGNSPLIDAVRTGDLPLTKELLVNGADKTIRNNKGMDVIDYAVKTRSKVIDAELAADYSDVVAMNRMAREGATTPGFMQKEAQRTFLQNNSGSDVVKVGVEQVDADNMDSLETGPVNSLQVAPVTGISIDGDMQKAPRIKYDDGGKKWLKTSAKNPANSDILYTSPNMNMTMAPAGDSNLPRSMQNRSFTAQNMGGMETVSMETGPMETAPAEFAAVSNQITPTQPVDNLQVQRQGLEVDEQVTNINFEPVTFVNAAPAGSAAADFDSTPASLKMKSAGMSTYQAPITPAMNSNLNTAPVDQLMVMRAETKTETAVARNAQQPAYEADVDALLNDYAKTVKVDQGYMNEVDSLLNNLAEDPAINGYTSNTSTNINRPASNINPARSVYSYENSTDLPTPAAPQGGYKDRDNLAIPASQFRRNLPSIPYKGDEGTYTYGGGVEQAPARQFAPVQVSQGVAAMPDAPFGNAQLAANTAPAKSGMNYNAYRNNLLQNVDQFYNKKQSNYGEYDISEMERQRMHNLETQKQLSIKAAEAEVVAEPIETLPSTDSSDLFKEEAAKAMTTPDIDINEVASIEPVRNEEEVAQTASDMPAAPAENFTIIKGFASEAEAKDFVATNSAIIGENTNNTVAKDEKSNMYQLTVGPVANHADAQFLCDKFAGSGRDCSTESR